MNKKRNLNLPLIRLSLLVGLLVLSESSNPAIASSDPAKELESIKKEFGPVLKLK